MGISRHMFVATMAVELCSLPCRRRWQARFARSTTWTSRSSVPTEIIGERCAVATGVGAEDASALSMIESPYPLAALTFSDLLTERSHVVAGGSLHSGRSLRGDRSRRAKMAESMPLAIGTDAPAGGTVPGGLSEVEGSSAPHGAQSSQLAGKTVDSCGRAATVAAQLGLASAEPVTAPVRPGRRAG